MGTQISRHASRTSAFSLSLWRGLILCCAAVLAACQHTDAGQTLGRDWIEALNSHNANRVISLLAPNATYSDPVTPAPLAIAAFRVRLLRDWAGWKDRVYLARRIIAANGSVVIEWQVRQTNASGEVVPVDGVTVLDTRDGQITAVREYYNAGVYLRFLRPRRQE
jgi:ketosteroid isomerase-like protein